METRIVESDRIVLVGFSFFGDPFAASGGWTEENEIGRLWSRFIAYIEQHGERIQLVDAMVGYEVHIEHPETAAKGHYEVFVGAKVAQLQDVPVQLLVKVLPPTRYAVFTLVGEEITADWSKHIYAEWMPAAGYQKAHPFMFELYDERFKGIDHLDESIIDIYVPVKSIPQPDATP